MEKVNKTVYKLYTKGYKAEGKDSIDKKTLNEIDQMSQSPEWELFLKKVNKKYKV